MTFYNFNVAVVLSLKLEPFFFKGTKNSLLASFSSLMISSSESTISYFSV